MPNPRFTNTFENTYVNYKDILNDIKNGKEVYLITISPNHLKDDPIEEITFSVFHEIGAHLIKVLGGNKSAFLKGDVAKDHIEYYDLNNNPEILSPTEIDKGSSPLHQDIPESSPAGKTKNVIEKIIK